jgi:hypothetical protein
MLQLVKKEDRTTVVVSLLKREGPLVAEKAIDDLADKEGDKAAVAVIKTLPALALADIIREFDYTKPSIIMMLVTPVHLRKVVERLPLFGDGASRTMQVVTGIVFQEDEWTKRRPFFTELGKSEFCVKALALALLYYVEEDEIRFFHHTKSFDFDGGPRVRRRTGDRGEHPPRRVGGTHPLLEGGVAACVQVGHRCHPRHHSPHR